MIYLFALFISILLIIQLTIVILTRHINKTYFISVIVKKNAMQKTLIIRSILNVKVINSVNYNNLS
jgi:hypothetical protein